MENIDYLSLAKAYSMEHWRFDIVLPAGRHGEWYYFSCTRKGRPKWSSLPCAIRINNRGEVEELEDFQSRREVSRMARLLTPLSLC